MLAPVVLAALLASPVCHGQQAPPTPEQERQRTLEGYSHARASFGFRSDIAYVEMLIRRGRWESDVGFIPVTRAEDRYLQLRDRIELGGRAYRYLRKRRDLSGGVSIEDDWPKGPYLLVRVTRDRERHQAALRRIYPHRLRTVAVRYSGVALLALQDRISADLEALEAEGFDIRSHGLDIEANRVRVQMVSARTDHQQVFADRYGPAVETFATADDTRLECADLDGVRVSSTGRSLVLRWTYSSGEALEAVELTEHPDRVEVGIVQRVPFFGGPDDAHAGRTRVQLSAPLRGRRVIDAATGRAP